LNFWRRWRASWHQHRKCSPVQQCIDERLRQKIPSLLRFSVWSRC
jgi:hypothetical protein